MNQIDEQAEKPAQHVHGHVFMNAEQARLDEVDAGHSMGGAVVRMQKRPWRVVSVRPTFRFGPIALAMIAITTWLIRRDTPRKWYGALVGLSFSIPIGLAFGFAMQLRIIDPQFPSYTSGNVAVDLAIFIGLVGCVCGIAIQCCRFVLYGGLSWP